MMNSPTEMFLEDHAKIRQSLKNFEQARDDAAKQQQIARSLAEIAIHKALRHELVIPAIRQSLGDTAVSDWASGDYEKESHAMEEIAATHGGRERADKFQGFA